MKMPITQDSQAIVEGQRVRKLVLPALKIYYKVAVKKTEKYWHKNSHIGHRTVWNLEIDPHIGGQLILNQCAKIIQWC